MYYIYLYYAELCPPGLTSPTRVSPCQPVPKDHYWVNTSHYEACPSGQLTLNAYGAESDSAESIHLCRGKDIHCYIDLYSLYSDDMIFVSLIFPKTFHVTVIY